MKILVSWLKEYVDVPVNVETLARDMTLCGFEVASVEPVDGNPDDAVIDFEITANRPDCLSVLGMAREVSVRYGTPLRDPSPASCSSGELPLRVTVEAPDLCPVYAAAMMDIRVGPSPDWLVARLTASGVRAINAIVDVTNYVLLELGQPLHAFDYDTIGGHHLRIRTAHQGETLTTLDGQVRTLAPDMLVIADEERAQAVAGVMGGAPTEISNATRTIALESAYFEPRQVRRTRRRLGLSTEASYRFERGTDPGLPVRALWRAVNLLERIGAGTPRPGTVVQGPTLARREVPLRWTRIGRVLGMEVAATDVEVILTGLGFSVQREGTGDPPVWRVQVPGWRGDVTREIDLIEEVARCAGYDKLPTTFPPLLQPPAGTAPRLARDRSLREVLVGAGFAECVTFTFIEREAAEPFDEQPVAIANPLSETFAVLRPSLLPGVIDSVSHNRRREQQDIRLFEVGTRFTKAHGETRSVAIAWTGHAEVEHWSRTGRAVDLFDLFGVVARVGQALDSRLHLEPASHSALLSDRSVRIVSGRSTGDRVEVGWAGQLLPRLADARGLPEHDVVLVAEIDLDLAAPGYAPDPLVTLQPLPRHPSVVRDISLLVRADLPAAIVRGTMQAAAPPTLVGVQEFDRYQGTSLPDGHVSLSLRLTFRHRERTLTDAEVSAAMDAIVAAVQEQHGATRR